MTPWRRSRRKVASSIVTNPKAVESCTSSDRIRARVRTLKRLNPVGEVKISRFQDFKISRCVKRLNPV